MSYSTIANDDLTINRAIIGGNQKTPVKVVSLNAPKEVCGIWWLSLRGLTWPGWLGVVGDEDEEEIKGADVNRQ